ncbi:ubiquitin carboxyl-terminal hydrolase 21-like isoform X2 [Puntigrus tetrazona]|nr:ubiquitin carboxyl-terminal hydrolase 21-like isoform X2 [Puntigrus tetrazona]
MHAMPSPAKERDETLLQTNAQDTRPEKHTEEDLCSVAITERSPAVMRYVGLENQGATCYLNTVLQILFKTEEFREAVKPYATNNSSSTIINCIAQLFERLEPRKETIATTEEITDELEINVYKQEDAAKCLQKILQKIQKNDGSSEISKIFQGVMAQTTICLNPAKHVSLKQVKPFFILSISLDSEPAVHMQTCFDSYFAPISMCGEDQLVYCKDCEEKMETEIISSLQEVPSVLVLHLERFEFDFDAMRCVKNYSSVQIPPQLLVEEDSGVKHSYDLYAIANHSGSLDGGHYYADIKDQDGWHRFDDSEVKRLQMNLTCDPDIYSDEAYLLLYKKSSSVTKNTFKHQKRRSKRKRDSFSEVGETESPEKRAKTLIRSEDDSRPAVSDKLDPLDESETEAERRTDAHHGQTTSNHSSDENDSDIDSEEGEERGFNTETEPGTSPDVRDEAVPENQREAVTITISDHDQPTSNISGENTTGTVLLKDSDAESETESNASLNTEKKSTLEMKSKDNPSSARQTSSRKALVKYSISISSLSLLVCLGLVLLALYCPPHLLMVGGVVLVSLLCLLLVLLVSCVVSYLLPVRFTSGRNHNSQQSSVI